MSKSKGNFITAREAISKWGSMTVRLALVSGHYRSQIDFNDGMMETASNSLERIKNMVSAVESQSKFGRRSLKKDINSSEVMFVKAMDDDFNTPKALAAIFRLVKKINKMLGSASKKWLFSAKDKVVELLGVLGVKVVLSEGGVLDDELINLLIKIREKARKNKNFGLSDSIRDGLKDLGVVLEDSSKKTKYHFVTKK